jgi:hypothetical protein
MERMEGVGGNASGDLTNVQRNDIQNCYNDFPPVQRIYVNNNKKKEFQ